MHARCLVFKRLEDSSCEQARVDQNENTMILAFRLCSHSAISTPPARENARSETSQCSKIESRKWKNELVACRAIAIIFCACRTRPSPQPLTLPNAPMSSERNLMRLRVPHDQHLCGGHASSSPDVRCSQCADNALRWQPIEAMCRQRRLRRTPIASRLRRMGERYHAATHCVGQRISRRRWREG